MKKHVPPRLGKLSTAKQRRLDKLLDRNSEGTISADEKKVLVGLVAEAEQIMLANAKLLAEFSDSETEGKRAQAVPVTVWVKPEQARR